MKFIIFMSAAVLLAANNNASALTIHQKSAAHAKDFNGADEDEIMDKVFSKYASEGTNGEGVKNGEKLLMKDKAPKAAGVILEATHKLKGAQVPGYIKANFEKTWSRFDINGDGFIKAEETHTFMRSLMGKLNKFALAPGSLSDIDGVTDSSSVQVAEETAAAPAKKAAVKAKKPAAKKEAAPTPAPAAAPEAAPADDTAVAQ